MLPESLQSRGFAGFGALVEFVELPLGGIAIEMGHALASHLGVSGGQEELQSLDVGATGKLLALTIHPENGEGKSSVDRRLSFLCVDAKDRKRRLAHAQQAAGVDRTAGMLQVGAAADGVEFPSGIVALQDALKDLPVAGADGAQGGRSASIAVSANLEDVGLRLAETEHAEVQHPRLQFGVEYPTDGVAFFRPEMQDAFAFAGDRVARGGEVEDGFAIFDCDGVRGFGEEGFEHPAQQVCRNGTALHTRLLREV